jgi:hypothetical protein
MGQPVVVDLPAEPRARGEAHGEQLRELIAEGIVRWKDSLAAVGDPQHWIDAFLSGSDHPTAIRAHAPSLLDEVDGIAAGAGVEPREMLAYQLVDEQWCFIAEQRRARAADHEHCSTFGVRGGGDRPTIVAQNLDLPVWWEGLQTVLRIPAWRDQPAQVVVTGAGFIVMNGLNLAGVAIGVNALPDLPSARTGLPVAFVIREALTRTTARDAAASIASVTHASGQNYIVGDRDDLIGIEADAEGTSVYGVDDRCLLHTNHTVERTAHADPGAIAGGALANSCARLDFLSSQRDVIARGDVDAAVRVLSDDTVPIRRVPTDVSPSSSFATCVFECGDRPVAHLRGGMGETEFMSVEPLGVRVP